MASPLRREWLLSVLAAVLAWLLWASGILSALERPAADLMSRLPRPGSAPLGPFAAVLIDDESIERLGPVPWPRSRLSELIDAVHAGGARGVLVDILLAEASNDADDAQLERALKQGPYALAAVLSTDGGWLLPLQRLGGSAVAAHAHIEVSTDGVMRRISYTKQAGGIALPALSLAAAQLAGWQGAIVPGRSLRPDFRQPPESIPSVSAHKLIDGTLPDRFFAGRVVFCGLAASGVSDQFVLPIASHGRPVPGVLVHAAAASSIVREGLLHPARGWLVVLITLVAAAMVQWTRTRAGRFRLGSILVIVGLVVLTGIASLWATASLLPLVALVLAVVVSAAGREALESREAQRETASVLASLIEQQADAEPTAPPGDVGAQLRLARRLQAQIALDRDLRRALLDGLREGVVLWDDSGAVLLANEAAAGLWGTTPSRDEVRASTNRVDGKAAGHTRGTTTKNGRELELETRQIEAGNLGLIRDVTAERELERHRSEMQRMVSHELKTPLASIAGFGAMIERYELDRDEQLRVAARVRSEADRLGDMVATFLDVERLGAGRWQAERSALDLGALAKDRCRFLGPKADEDGLEFEISATDGCTVLGSAELLTRLLDNLVGNAIKYSVPGTSIRVTVARPGTCVELEVRDNGPGIPDDALPHLFESFYRVPGGESPGTGLGLALVREIADWHGADISVQSELGRGSVFRVKFPIANHEEEP